jgi:hypothetical protein
MEDRLAIKIMPQINLKLFNLSKLQTFTLLDHEEFFVKKVTHPT